MIIFRVLPSEHLISHLMDDDDGAAAAGRRPLDTTIRYERQHVHHIMMPSPEDECNDIELPGHVQTWAQLQHLPTDYLNLVDHHHHHLSGSGIHHYRDHHRPLVHVDAHGNYYTHALNPLKYSVFIILILELLERFSFYGLYMSQTNYLTGSYNENWNANMSSMEAASIISLSTAVAYTVPFVGGMLADSYLGDYKTILMGVCCFYLPGLFVIASSTFPNAWLGTTSFNATAYKIALLFLWPVGTGTIKAVVNVFGARQYHPILQRSLVESYYVQFYMVINVGAVAGCVVIPVAARSSITMAYSIPFVLLFAALLVFVAGSKRYVDVIPLGHRSSSRRPQQLQNHGVDQPTFADVAKICALIIPFNIVYGQCPTTCKLTITDLPPLLFLLLQNLMHEYHPYTFRRNSAVMVQGAVMEPFLGFIEAPSMDILDSVSVLVCGYFVSSYFYP
jgi:POT family proton-dependent oligopeptide transporter